ncbi:MAG TPA: TonB-dependent receptor [Rhodanobacter sp.]
MLDVSGKTSNGCTYEGEYQPARGGRVHWSATFRRNGDYAGMRHGCVHGMLDADAASVDAAVKLDIETTWTQAT